MIDSKKYKKKQTFFKVLTTPKKLTLVGGACLAGRHGHA
jgi:hypothetical protein